jgi:DNA invertase Pin-like site-specific DNA recombinase
MPAQKKSNGKCIIYCRVSTQAQMNNGNTETQRKVCKAWANNNNFTIVKYVSEACSAYNVFNKSILPAMTKSIKYVVIYDVSRFCRNVVRGLKLADEIAAKGYTIIFAHENFAYHSGSPARTKIMLQKQLAQAEMESKNIGRRSQAGKKARESKGHFIRIAPYGYTKYIDENKITKIKPNQLELNILKFINLAKTLPMSRAKLRKQMACLTNVDMKKTPINIYDQNSESVEEVNYIFNNAHIARWLNEYGLKKRGKSWSQYSVNTVLKYITDSAKTDCNVMKKLTDYLNDELSIMMTGKATVEPDIFIDDIMGADNCGDVNHISLIEPAPGTEIKYDLNFDDAKNLMDDDDDESDEPAKPRTRSNNIKASHRHEKSKRPRKRKSRTKNKDVSKKKRKQASDKQQELMDIIEAVRAIKKNKAQKKKARKKKKGRKKKARKQIDFSSESDSESESETSSTDGESSTDSESDFE